jgi:hypothetical protein
MLCCARPSTTTARIGIRTAEVPAAPPFDMVRYCHYRRRPNRTTLQHYGGGGVKPPLLHFTLPPPPGGYSGGWALYHMYFNGREHGGGYDDRHPP